MAVGLSNVTGDILTGHVTGGQAYDAGGEFVKLHDPIGEIGFNGFQNDNIYAFHEAQSFTLKAALQIGPGNFLSAGTMIDSHMVFFDPNESTTQISDIIFAGEILGVITTANHLLASHDIVGNRTANYSTIGFMGIEEGDIVMVDPLDTNRLLIDWQAASPGDHIRVLTVPADAPTLYGDLNLDCVVNLLDVAPFVDLISNGLFQEEGDMNQDGVVNLLDVAPFVSVLAGN